jgi:hypothetical protein
VVAAGEFCDENLELMLEIHEFLREPGLESGGVTLPGCFSELERPSSVGRFAGIFCAGVGVLGGAEDGVDDSWTGVTTVSGLLGSS